MKFGKSATIFDSQAVESCPNGRRNACTVFEMHALPPELAGKGVFTYRSSALGVYSHTVSLSIISARMTAMRLGVTQDLIS